MNHEKKTVLVSLMVFVRNINSEGFEVWTQKRKETGPLFGKMEFPGGKIDYLSAFGRLETPLEAVIREVDEEVGLDLKTVTKNRLFKIHSYETDTKIITLYVHTVHQKVLGSLSQLDSIPDSKWLKIDYKNLTSPYIGVIPEANHGFLDELSLYFKDHYQFESFLFL